jgi:ribosome biogenesis GTPase A
MINWFPGHMVAAQKKALESLAHVDVVIEVLDARCPSASINPTINEMRALRRKPALKVLSKVDVADSTMTPAWLLHLNEQPETRAIALCSKSAGEAKRVISEAKQLAPQNLGRPLRLMMMGVPNVGKSTLINSILGRRAAQAKDEPAVTKVINTYELADATLLYDTPGMTWKKMDRETDGLLLAANHLIGVGAYQDGAVAAYLAAVLLEHYPSALAERYKFDPAGLNGMEVIAEVAVTRGYLGKAGVRDLDKAATTLLLDYRSGALGKITLEAPNQRYAEHAAT